MCLFLGSLSVLLIVYFYAHTILFGLLQISKTVQNQKCEIFSFAYLFFKITVGIQGVLVSTHILRFFFYFCEKCL